MGSYPPSIYITFKDRKNIATEEVAGRSEAHNA